MSDSKRALLTGITGQDGSYLAELLLDKGYEVYGVVRRASTERFERIEGVRDRIELIHADLLDQSSLTRAFEQARPTEVYNLGAQSFVPTSWTEPTLTAQFTGLGVTRMLEALRQVTPDARFYQASSSEMFGKVLETPQKEDTPFYPRSPYAAAKWAINGLTKTLAMELGPVGVRVNAIAPGIIATEMSAVTRSEPDRLAKFLTHVPMGRVGQPGELVGPVVFLVSPMSSYVTGVVLPVDGGLTLGGSGMFNFAAQQFGGGQKERK